MNNGSFDSSKDLWPKPKGRPASIVIPMNVIPMKQEADHEKI